MKYCSKCGSQIQDEAVVCVHCGCAADEGTKNNKNEYNVFCIVGFISSFFVSFVGLALSIIGLCQVNKNINQKGRELAIAGISVAVALFLVALAFIFVMGLIVSGYYSHIV